MWEFVRLLWGTVVYRPYVYTFLFCFLFFAWHHMGMRNTFIIMVVSYLAAFISEFASTRIGIPFGYYYYLDWMRDRELWISNVPFWDSLSFVFLSYFSFSVATFLLSRRKWQIDEVGQRHPLSPVLGGLLMMALDLVIDPVALQGRKWFLGEMYGYPHYGFYFGVTFANFLGWFLLGVFSQYLIQKILFGRGIAWSRIRFREPRQRLSWLFALGVLGVYFGVFGFNLAMTVWIQDYELVRASSLVILGTSVMMWGLFRQKKHAESESIGQEAPWLNPVASPSCSAPPLDLNHRTY